jgi:peptidyl-tRNA hydrolase, PTH1 family
MKLIFAQGNPGSQYTNTRHNVGWLVANTLAQQHGADFKHASKFLANIAEGFIDTEKIIIAKPTTFYNETGQSFNAIKQFYKLRETDIIMVHDELALPFGTLRSRVGGADAGNNGVKSINSHGGTHTTRLRIGVGSDQRSVMGDTDFVLGRFTKAEQDALEKTIVPKCIEVINEFISEAHSITSHKLLD